MQTHGTYGLSGHKLELLRQLFDEAIASSSTGRFANAYDVLFAMISTGPMGTISDAQAGDIFAGNATIDYDLIRANKFDGGWQPIDNGVDQKVDQGAWLFLQGVSGVNAGTADDPYAIYAREYTAFQHKTRFGLAPDADVSGLVQEASDAIAESILRDILDDPVDNTSPSYIPNENHFVPSAFGIATQDADAAVDGTTGTNGIFRDGEIGGWVGNIAFLFLGIDDPYRENVLHEGSAGDAYDVLSVIAASWICESLSSLTGKGFIYKLCPLGQGHSFACNDHNYGASGRNEVSSSICSITALRTAFCTEREI